MATIEAASYNVTRRALMKDPIVRDMAVGVKDVPLNKLAHDDGTPRFEFMQGANAEYTKRGGTNHAHIGAIAEALLLILKEGTTMTATDTATTTTTTTTTAPKTKRNAAYARKLATAKAFRAARRAEMDQYPILITLDF